MNATSNYQFVPAYYEWHFVDGDGNVLLNWVDPVESLYYEWDEDGEYLDEPKQFTTYDEVLCECQAYIETGDMNLEDDDEYHGVSREDWEQLPENAAEIMAMALYNYYIV